MFHTIYAYGYWNNDNRWNTNETSNETAIFHAPFLMCFIVLRIELSRLLFSLLKGLKPTVNFSRIFFLFWLYTYIQFLWVIQCLTFIYLYRPLGPFHIMLYIDVLVRFAVPCRGRDSHYRFMLVGSISA